MKMRLTWHHPLWPSGDWYEMDSFYPDTLFILWTCHRVPGMAPVIADDHFGIWMEAA